MFDIFISYSRKDLSVGATAGGAAYRTAVGVPLSVGATAAPQTRQDQVHEVVKARHRFHSLWPKTATDTI